MRNRKRLRIIIILLAIWFVVSFALSQIIANDYFKNMFWASTAFLAAGTMLDLNEWSKLGLNIDKSKSQTIQRSFDDSTALLIVFYSTMLSLMVLLDSSNNNLMTNNYSIIITFVMTLEFELFMYLSILSARKDTARLLKKNK